MREREDSTRLDNLERKVDNLLTTVTNLRRCIYSLEGEVTALRRTRPTLTPAPPRVGTYHEVWARQRTNGPIMVQTRARLWEKGDGSWCVSTSSEYPDPDPWTFATHGDAIRWLGLGGYAYVRAVVR